MNEIFIQGYPDTSRMLKVLTLKNYAPDPTRKVQDCQICIRSKPCSNRQLRPPVEQIYDPNVGLEDVKETDLVGEITTSIDYTHILTACHIFSKHLLVAVLRQPSTSAIAHAFLQFFAKSLDKYWLDKALRLLLKYWKNSISSRALISIK